MTIYQALNIKLGRLIEAESRCILAGKLTGAWIWRQMQLGLRTRMNSMGADEAGREYDRTVDMAYIVARERMISERVAEMEG